MPDSWVPNGWAPTARSSAGPGGWAVFFALWLVSAGEGVDCLRRCPAEGRWRNACDSLTVADARRDRALAAKPVSGLGRFLEDAFWAQPECWGRAKATVRAEAGGANRFRQGRRSRGVGRSAPGRGGG